jgi:sugar lactone lactonase YvrE
MQRLTMSLLPLAVAGAITGGITWPLNAQAPSGVSSVDSASVARQAWGRGVRALNANDLATARTEIRRAALAWPAQPTYLWGRAYTAALAHDTTDVVASLDQYAAYGIGRSLRGDSAFFAYRGLAPFDRVAARLDANLAPVVHSTIVATLADSTFWPEGVDYDARTRRYYVASVRHRTVAEIGADGASRELWARGTPGIGAVLGVRVDTARRVLWVTTSGIRQMEGFTPADSAIAALLRVRISDGAIEQRWDLAPSPRGHVLGDLAVGPNGDVWLTDSSEPFMYRLRAGRDSLERIESPLFRSLQGVAPTKDGRVVFIADYSHGLLVFDVASGVVRRLDDAPGSTSLGCDGIVLDGKGAIIAVQNGVSPARVVRFVVDPSRRRVVSATLLDRNVKVADEPTIGTIAGGRYVYVANSQWEKYDDDGARRPAVALTAPVLLGIALP